MKKIDLQGQRFGRLIVLKEIEGRKNGSVVWLCKCDCNNFTEVRGHCLKIGNVQSCGCLCKEKAAELGRKRLINLMGQKFGKLTVIKKLNKRSNRYVSWRCQCSCGRFKEVCSGNLKNGGVKSCGCLQDEATRKRIRKLRMTKEKSLRNLYWSFDYSMSEIANKYHVYPSTVFSWFRKLNIPTRTQSQAARTERSRKKKKEYIRKNPDWRKDYKHTEETKRKIKEGIKKKILEERNLWGIGTKLRAAYNAMLTRCYKPNTNVKAYYYDKGIIVCSQWLDKIMGFTNFRNWAYESGYEDHLVIHRKDSSGNYEPANCEWLSPSEHAKKNNETI